MEKVKCRICLQMKDPKAEYYYAKGKRLARCKECQKAYAAEWLRMNREEMKENARRAEIRD